VVVTPSAVLRSMQWERQSELKVAYEQCNRFLSIGTDSSTTRRSERLWTALKDWEVERRWDVLAPPGFRNPGKVHMFGSMYPKPESTSSEGKRLWKMQQEIERDLG
jgi:hypothetical protein